MKDTRQLADERAKVHPIFGGKVDEQPAAVKAVLAAHHLDVEAVFAGLGAADGQRLLLLVLPLVALDHIPGIGAAQHAFHFAHHLFVADLVRRLYDLGHFGPAGRIHHDILLMGKVKQLAGIKVVDLGYRLELDANYDWHRVFSLSSYARGSLWR
jgi:hypothetical protein